MMSGVILARTGIIVLKKHATRSILTVLGIMIGIAAIIITFSIGRGAEIKVREQILAIGENTIYIIPGNIVERGTIRSGSANPIKLKEKDIYALKESSSEIKEISRGHDSLQTIEFGSNSVTERVFGSDANMLKINQNTIRFGAFFSEREVLHRINVVVLGAEIAKKMFKNQNPVSETVHIKKIPFTVIGVLDYIEHFWGTQDPNMRVYVPFTVAKKYFRKDDEADDDVSAIALGLYNELNPGVALRKIKRTLRFMHDTAPLSPDDFTIFDQQSISDSATSASNVIKLFGLIAASISLIVGGIGVMNIMLVSVQERTREIGIRLAIGATKRDIQLQFLFEAVVLSTLGGIMGVLMGIGLLHVLSSLTSLPTIFEATPLVLAFVATILTGIFFGYYPALKASTLNPVDALLNKK